MGAITPIGLSVDEFWVGVKEGRTDFDKITRFDTRDLYTEDVEYALSNSLGFGGHNASLLVKKYYA